MTREEAKTIATPEEDERLHRLAISPPEEDPRCPRSYTPWAL